MNKIDVKKIFIIFYFQDRMYIFAIKNDFSLAY